MTDHHPPAAPALDAGAAADYQRVAKAIRYLAEHRRHQPELEAIAAHVGLSPFHFQRLFVRWAGVSPKQFLGTLTVAHAKRLLRERHSVLETTLGVGLSGPSRLHDLFLRFEAMTPGEYKRLGAGLAIRHGLHPTPFGLALLLLTTRGICGLRFVEPGDEARALAEARAEWPLGDFEPDSAATGAALTGALGGAGGTAILARGTRFQVQVWRALLALPPGRVCAYGDIARALGRPRAARAVGTAVGTNPVALLIPCHRALRASGELGGYRWGEERKLALLGWEAARAAAG